MDGVLTYNALTGSDDIDWSKYALDVPTINVPKLTLPNLGIAKLDTPVLSLEQPVVSLETGNDVPKLETSTINTAMVVNGTETPKLTLPTENLQEYKEFIEELQKTFTDRRNIGYESQALNPGNSVLFSEWISIYKQYQNMPSIAFVPITTKFRMISEVSPLYTQKEMEILDKNLVFYKSEDYDSVLVTFTKDDNPSAVLNTIKYIIKTHNMKVWLAYSGAESLKETAFMPVNEYTNILASCAPYITGYVNSWRRTSVHLWKQELAFMNYTNHILRLNNPNVAILGELYYGETAKYINEKYPYGWDTNAFPNESGLVLSNSGYQNLNFKYLFNKLLPSITGNKNYPYVGLVIGPHPYYRGKTNLDYASALKIKHDIENKFFKYNCVGTITLSSDGKSDGTNDLTKNVYNTL